MAILARSAAAAEFMRACPFLEPAAAVEEDFDPDVHMCILCGLPSGPAASATSRELIPGKVPATALA